MKSVDTLHSIPFFSEAGHLLQSMITVLITTLYNPVKQETPEGLF